MTTTMTGRSNGWAWLRWGGWGAILAVATLAAAEGPTTTIWVSPQGSDRQTGTENAPLATLATAVRRARELRRLGDPAVAHGIRIQLQAGHYALTEPVWLRAEDSGTAESPTVIAGAEGGRSRLSGGLEVRGWTRLTGSLPGMAPRARGQLWVADVPMFHGRGLEFRQFWVNDRKAIRARTPDDGRMERLVRWDRAAGEAHLPLDLRWPAEIRGVELVLLQAWEIAVLRVRSVERQAGATVVGFHDPERRIQSEHPWPQPVMDGPNGAAPFFLTGSLAFLDAPGEWHLDRMGEKLYYWPRPGEDMTVAKGVVPGLETLLVISGTHDRPVAHVTLRNLDFAHTTWLRPSLSGHVPLQAGFPLLDAYGLSPKGTPDWRGLDNQAWTARPPAAVRAVGASHLRFEGCRFEHTAANGVDLQRGVTRSEIEGCLFRDIGISGFVAGEFGGEGVEVHLPYRPDDDRDVCARLRVANSVFHDCATEDWGGVAILAGAVSDTTIEHNEIAFSSYTGISLGWGWTRSVHIAGRNRVHANHIHHVATRVSDSAGIYTLSAQPGTVISENAVHSLVMSPYVHDPEHWFYLYADEGTSEVTFRDNWCPEPRFLQNANGPGNRWENNGPQVDDSVRRRAGLAPRFQHLLAPVAELEGREPTSPTPKAKPVPETAPAPAK